MRVLFSSTWGHGHIYPMVPLAQAFLAAGHDVLWATSADSCRHVAAAGLAVAPAGLAGDDLKEALGVLNAAVAQVAPQDRAAFMFPRMFGETFTAPMVTDLLPLARQWRPDLLIHEHGELASPVVGALLEVPSVTHSFGGAIPADFVAEAGNRTSEVWAEHGLTQPPYAGCFTTLYLDICPPSVQSVPMTHIDRVQPLRMVAATEPAPDVLPAYLHDDGRPLVYVTLGTVNNKSPVLRAAVDGLAALPVRVLVAVGPDGDPAALGSQPPNVHVERWVHQPLVLDHCAVVVSHGGSGTFLGALARGLPQLCLPQAADQFRNAAGGARTGAALVLAPPETTPETIARDVRRLLDEDSFRIGAGRVAAEIGAMASPADVVAALLDISSR
ncbi:MAG: hypothetical protein QOG52_45 [Frankiaceae bacterium]|nr:hypothetical protein [Frankiaceae bacterium]